jgi:hypothetical protein
MSDACCAVNCLECPIIVSTLPPIAGSLRPGALQFDANTGLYYYQFMGKNLVLNPSYGVGLNYDLTNQSVNVKIKAGGGLTFDSAGALQVSCQQLITNCGFVTQTQLQSLVTAMLPSLVAPLIPAPINIIAGTNVTITGTYPNITVNATTQEGKVYTGVEPINVDISTNVISLRLGNGLKILNGELILDLAPNTGLVFNGAGQLTVNCAIFKTRCDNITPY